MRAYEFMNPKKSVEENIVDEMSLSTYKPIGDFSKPGPFKDPEHKLVTHPTHIKKVEQFLENTPYDFRIFVSNLPGKTKYRESGVKTPDEIREIFGKYSDEILSDTENSITIIYMGNFGAEKVILTPWMMAHRLGHAINIGIGFRNDWHMWRQAEQYFFKTINAVLNNYYGKVPQTVPSNSRMLNQLTSEYNALFNYIGTQRSSKTNKIKRPYEFFYELFAQYIKTGTVTLNPLPTNLGYGRKAWGTPTKYMYIKPEFRDELDRSEVTERLTVTLNALFNDVLDDSVGKIFVM